jgi:hypothetical protein
MSAAVTVDRSTKIGSALYRRLLSESVEPLIYQTPEWSRFLSMALADAEPVLLLANQGAQPVGAFVAFLRRGPLGVALNALPYFGSHGDFLVSPKAADPREIVAALAEALAEFKRAADVQAINIVAHPFLPQVGAVAATLGLTAWDRRIGQISPLAPASSREEALQATLDACRQKTRNLARKAMRQGFVIELSEQEADWAALIEQHRLGMARIGGQAKSRAEFSAMRECFVGGAQRRLYVARRDGRFAGGLLCFYHGGWVEYFAPVAVEEFRNEQVLSALIVEAIVEARLEGRRFWNWGGTWTGQTGVYHFKRGWGALDHVYHYYGAVSGAMADAAPDELRAGYPFFYIRPFSSAAGAARGAPAKPAGEDGERRPSSA